MDCLCFSSIGLSPCTPLEGMHFYRARPAVNHCCLRLEGLLCLENAWRFMAVLGGNGS